MSLTPGTYAGINAAGNNPSLASIVMVSDNTVLAKAVTLPVPIDNLDLVSLHQINLLTLYGDEDSSPFNFKVWNITEKPGSGLYGMENLKTGIDISFGIGGTNFLSQQDSNYRFQPKPLPTAYANLKDISAYE
jgi:hypothetical protein